MRPRLRDIWALMMAACLLFGCAEATPRSAPLSVVATITPLADWTRQVGGDRVSVEMIVPPGVDPRGYVPSPEQRQRIQTAGLVIMNGLGLEPWIDEILDEVPVTAAIVLDVSQFTGPLTERVPARGRHVPDDPDSSRGRMGSVEDTLAPAPVYSPYLWLDAGSALNQINLLAHTLARVDPDGIMVYRRNAARYSGEVENLDGRIHRQLDDWDWDALLVTDRFLYPFAQRYHRPLQLLDDPARRAPVPAKQPLVLDQFAPDLQHQQATNKARPIAVINPLGGQTYIELMWTNFLTMTSVMADDRRPTTDD